MAIQTTNHTLGIDVAKDWLDIYDGETSYRIDNQIKAIGPFLSRYAGKLDLAIEPIAYHADLVRYALSKEHSIYLIDAYRLFRYREAVGVRAKTDKQDPVLLHRYLYAEKPHLAPFTPADDVVQSLFKLLKVRHKLMQTHVALKQSIEHHSEVKETLQPLIHHLKQAINKIDDMLLKRVQDSGLKDDHQRCIGIPGIGPLNSFALTAVFHRGVFRNADAFVAYLGLDVRVRDSGRSRGKRKLTKKGSTEVRRLLFNATRSGAQMATWSEYYQSLRSRGLSATAAYNALARKLARLAFALLRDQAQYQATT